MSDPLSTATVHRAEAFLERADRVLSLDASDDVKKHLLGLLDERDKEAGRQRLEWSKWRWSTPLAVALTGLITLSANFSFDWWRGRAATQNTITLEMLQQELGTASDRTKAEIAAQAASNTANLNIKAEEKRFQFEIVRSEFAKEGSTQAQRAASLLFLARSGILSDLDVEELKSMAEEALKQTDTGTESQIIPPLTPAEGGGPRATFLDEENITFAPSDFDGFVIHVQRTTDERYREIGRAATLGSYEVFYKGEKLEGASGTTIEAGGAGSPIAGSNRPIPIGVYPLKTHIGRNYATVGYSEEANSEAKPQPSIGIGETGDRTGIIIGPAPRRFGCCGIIMLSVDELSNSYAANYHKMVELIELLREKSGAAFPTENGVTIPKAWLVVNRIDP